MTDGDEVDGVQRARYRGDGNAGDVWLMHPWMLHNIARNTPTDRA